MKRLINSFIIKMKLLYYTVVEHFDNDVVVDLSSLTVREEHKSNYKLANGVRRLVKRLRSMSLSDRVGEENLLCKESYKKTRSEKMATLRVLDTVNKNPILRTEDDLVNKVVKLAPAYAKEAELKTLRKDVTACLRRAAADPTNALYVDQLKALKGKQKRLMSDIVRIKSGM